MADLAGGADVGAGIVVDRDGHVDAVFEVLLDRDDRCELAGEDDVECVGAALRPQAHVIADAEFAITDVQRFDLSRRAHRAVKAHELVAGQRVCALQQRGGRADRDRRPIVFLHPSAS